jgi:putative DNA primase/helicase
VNRTEWKPLTGKSAVLLPDNDEPGKGWVELVTKQLAHLEPPATIRVLALPVAEKGHDVHDWVKEVVPEQWDLGDCAIELQRLAAQTPIWVPPPGCAPLPKVQPDDDGPPKLSELGNARRLIKAHGGEIRYDHDRGEWLMWDRSRWSPDKTGAIWRFAKKIPQLLLKEAADTYDYDLREVIVKWSIHSEQRRVIENAIKLAWSENGIGISAADFDTDPWALNCPNGVVDLLTGELRDQKPEDLVTKLTAYPYLPDRACPRWLQFLCDIFQNDEQLIAFVQRALGYSMTGDTSEHCFFFCYGPTGRNGKNTLLEVCAMIMGDYSAVTQPKIMLTSSENDHPTAIADLVGRRFVYTSEMDRGQQLAEAQVKRLTGDRFLKARFMHRDFFEFPVRFKLWLVAQAQPKIRGRDEGIWSRIKVIPFRRFFADKDRVKGLARMLVDEEGPGILAWLVEGAREWHRIGLSDPPAVTQASKVYRRTQDALSAFLATWCIDHRRNEHLRDRVRVRPSELYARYVEWCKDMGEQEVLSAREFALDLGPMGFPLRSSDGIRYRWGLELRSEPEELDENMLDQAEEVPADAVANA